MSRFSRPVAVLLLASALGLGAVVPAVAVAESPAPSAGAAAKKKPRKPSRARLSAFSGCQPLVAYARAAALARDGLVPVYQDVRESDRNRTVSGGDSGSGAPTAMPAPARAEAQGVADMAAESETNVQEAGVDEPDVVKVSRGIVYAVAGGRLHIVDARDGKVVALATLDLPTRAFEHELLLHDKRLLVLSQGFAEATDSRGGGSSGGPAVSSSSPYFGGNAQTILSEIDVRDARAPVLVRTLEAEGRYVSARRQGATVRVVTSASPSPIVLPAPAEGEPYAQGAEFERRRDAAIAAAGPATFLPEVVVRNAGTRDEQSRTLSCARVRRPQEFSGLETLTVLTLDLERGIQPVDTDAILASGDQVYASADGLYVATTRYFEPGRPFDGTATTRIHRFAAGPKPETRYRASGSVRGFTLNQFAFSEHGGVLRVATTEDPPFAPQTGEQAGESESFVTVLDQRDDALVTVGRVGGLGRGERIYAVRFIGDVGYVVTFRQVDPLYTLDLSDPRAPRVRGELKILGYSAYLHPVGEDLLVGVGQDATAEGRRRGSQVSLFDVSDPAAPRKITGRSFSPTSSSSVEWDHRAFLWWPATRLMMLPLTDYASEKSFRGAVGFRISRADGLAEVGRVQHTGGERFGAGVRRSLVVGGLVLTLSEDQLVASRLRDLNPVGVVELPGVQPAPGGGPEPQPARPPGG